MAEMKGEQFTSEARMPHVGNNKAEGENNSPTMCADSTTMSFHASIAIMYSEIRKQLNKDA